MVIRRVGGLEVRPDAPHGHGSVIRRVGGLEVPGPSSLWGPAVIRRVGGLEVLLDFGVAVFDGYPPCRRLRSPTGQCRPP